VTLAWVLHSVDQSEGSNTTEWVDMTMTKALKDGFPPFQDERSLRSAIESVCARFGRVAHLELLPATRRPNLQCACFVRLDSEAAQNALRSKLHVIEFDGTLGFFAELDETWTGPTM
jgi:hypothetical protein